MTSAGAAVDVAKILELGLQKQREKVEAERENSLQEEVGAITCHHVSWGVMNIAPR